MEDTTVDASSSTSDAGCVVREAEAHFQSLSTTAEYHRNDLLTMVEWLEFARNSEHPTSLRYNALMEAIEVFSDVYTSSEDLDIDLHEKLAENLDIYGECVKELLNDLATCGDMSTIPSTPTSGGDSREDTTTRSLSPLAEYLFEALFDNPIHGFRILDMTDGGWRTRDINDDPFSFITTMKSCHRNHYHAIFADDLNHAARHGSGNLGRQLQIYVELFDLHDEVGIPTEDIAPRSKEPEEYVELFLAEPDEDRITLWWNNTVGQDWAEYYQPPNAEKFD